MRWIERASLVGLACGLAPSSAWGANVLTRTCLTISTSFQAPMVDDFLTDPVGPYKARGVVIESIQRSDGQWVAFLTLTPDSGVDAGCDVRLLDDAYTYTYTFASIARVNNNYIQSFDEMGWIEVNQVEVDPSVDDEFVFTVAASPLWNTMVAATRAIARSSMGLVDEVIAFTQDECPASPSSCYGTAEEMVFIHPANSLQKHVIVHEMGHRMAHLVTGSLAGPYDYESTDPDCPEDLSSYDPSNPSGGHALGSVEWHSAAIKEAMANYYAAVAFNDTSGAAPDCVAAYSYPPFRLGVVPYQVDLDFCWHSSACGPPYPLSPDYFYCDDEGSGHQADDMDHLAERCPSLVASSATNMATEIDWMRTFWDMTTEPYQGASLSPGDIFSIVGDADPSSWVNDDTVGPNDVGHGPTELVWAAFDRGVEDIWLARTLGQGVAR